MRGGIWIIFLHILTIITVKYEMDISWIDALGVDVIVQLLVLYYVL